MNYVATWIYMDKKGEETNFPQTQFLSSTKSHQDIYWRCVYIFFKFAIKYLNTSCEFLLFTNYAEDSYYVDNIDVIKNLKNMNVKIINRDFTFKLPIKYYGEWGNQLYEFDILDEFEKRFDENSKLLMLDSDCIITQNISGLFDLLEKSPAITFRGEYKGKKNDIKINGITEIEMTQLAKEYNPDANFSVNYLCGEFLCMTYELIKKINEEFPKLHNFMVNKFLSNPSSDTIKYNEEAHFLSYFYAKYNVPIGEADSYIKRLWTADNYYVIKDGDENLPIWHVLSGKNRYIKLLPDIDKFLQKDQKYIISKLKKLFFKRNSEYEKKMLFIRIYNKIKK